MIKIINPLTLEYSDKFNLEVDLEFRQKYCQPYYKFYGGPLNNQWVFCNEYFEYLYFPDNDIEFTFSNKVEPQNSFNRTIIYKKYLFSHVVSVIDMIWPIYCCVYCGKGC